jgi:hypothetical protein
MIRCAFGVFGLAARLALCEWMNGWCTGSDTTQYRNIGLPLTWRMFGR